MTDVDDRLHVERADRAEVDHLGRDLLLVERIGHAQQQVDLPAVADQGDVRAFLGDSGLAELDGVLTVRHLALGPVEGAGLEEDDRVGIADCGQHHPLGVFRGGRGDDLEARELAIEALDAVRVLGRELDAAAVWPADHHRHVDLAAGEVVHLGRVLDDLVGCLEGEVPGHHLDDRAHAGHGHADRRAGEAALGNRRVDHALRSEAVDQAVRDEVGATVNADVLAHDDDTFIALHLVRHRGAERLSIGDYRHLAADPFWMECTGSVM